MKESRSHCRIHQDAPVDLTWMEGGKTRVTQGRCLDISVGGLRIESTTAIPRDTEVMLHAGKFEFSGSASVRHVTSSGANFVLGLEFSERARQEIYGVSSDLDLV